MSSTAIRSPAGPLRGPGTRSEEHTSELQSQSNLVCRLLLEEKQVRAGAEAVRRHPRNPVEQRERADQQDDLEAEEMQAEPRGHLPRRRHRRATEQGFRASEP